MEKFIKRLFEFQSIREPVESPTIEPDKNRGDGSYR
jgi:hypothetical protein